MVMMSAAPLLPEDRIGAYAIDRLLGQSGYAVVYAALRLSDGLAVAVKEFLPTRFVHRERDGTVALSDSADELDFKRALAKFTQQGEEMSRCEHPNLVKTHEVFAERGTAYIVMDLVHGQRLSEAFKLMMIAEETQLNSLLVSLGSALQSIHEKGLVHGYVQPRHIILTADESPVLLDFAGARRLVSTSTDSDGSLLAKGYAAPEQYTSDDLSPAADMYGLGAVMYCAISGEAPADALSRMVMKDNGERIRAAVESASGLFTRKFLATIDSALVLDPARRTQSFPDWWYTLEHGAIAPDANHGSAENTTDLDPTEPASAGSEVDEDFIEAFQSRLNEGTRPDLARRIGSRPPQSSKPWRWAIPVGIATLVFVVSNDPLGLFVGSPKSPDVESAESVGLPLPAPGVSEGAANQVATSSEPTALAARDAEAGSKTENATASPEAPIRAEASGSSKTLAETAAPTVTLNKEEALPLPSTGGRVQGEAERAEAAVAVSSLGSQGDKQSVGAVAESTNSDEPVNSELTDAEQEEIDGLLRAARDDINANRLTSPAGRNAFERFSRVLRMDPENAGAKAGLEAVVERYIGLAKRAYRRGDAARVATYLARAERVLPGFPRTAQVRAELGNP